MKERLTIIAAALFAGMMMCHAQEAKIKGKDKKREILLSKERYFA